MAINFSKLISSSTHIPIEPRDIFMALPNKDKDYGYPRDVQAEVWKQWFCRKDEKNLIIKMNTGSGKTTVGLTILQSCYHAACSGTNDDESGWFSTFSSHMLPICCILILETPVHYRARCNAWSSRARKVISCRHPSCTNDWRF